MSGSAQVTTLLASAGAGVGGLRVAEGNCATARRVCGTGMLFSVVSARAAVVRVPELTNAVVGGTVR